MVQCKKCIIMFLGLWQCFHVISCCMLMSIFIIAILDVTRRITSFLLSYFYHMFAISTLKGLLHALKDYIQCRYDETLSIIWLFLTMSFFKWYPCPIKSTINATQIKIIWSSLCSFIGPKTSQPLNLTIGIMFKNKIVLNKTRGKFLS